jgi:hypothetical protein
LSGSWCAGHDKTSLGSIGVIKGARVVFAKPGVLEAVRAVDFMSIGEEKPEVVKGFVRDELELGKGVLIGSGSCKVGDERSIGCLGWKGRSYGGSGVVESGWHCWDFVVRVLIAVRGLLR